MLGGSTAGQSNRGGGYEQVNFTVDGIDVKDEKGQVVGKSPKAGFIAISQVALSRVATAFPALTIPPLIVAALERPLLSRVPILRTPLNLGKNPTFVFKPHCSRFPIDPSR